jgi:hypothetical protein
MVLAHAGGYELIVPLVMLVGLLIIMRGGDPRTASPRCSQVTVAGVLTASASQRPTGRSDHGRGESLPAGLLERAISSPSGRPQSAERRLTSGEL